MREEVFKEISSNIDEVSKFLKFGRKRIAIDTKNQLDDVEKEAKKLISTVNEKKNTIAELTNENQNQNGTINELTAENESQKVTINELSSENESQKATITELSSENASQKGIITELSSENESQKATITELTKENKNQKGIITELTEENENKKCLIEKLELKNSDSTTKLQLISNTLSAKGIENESFIKFRALIQNDFIEFANSASSLQEEAEAILRLQLIEKQIEKMLSFSGISDKNIIAIGGGFSAGKSEFISSFFKDTEIKLPIGIKPVTAIPTYITSSANNRIKAFTQKGSSVPIDSNLYKELSHDFVKSFKFNLKDIMPAMSIETPLNYKNICFIDTPGYNSSDTSEGFTNEDINTAKEFLEQANVLLWLVGLDSNGTISTSDLEFIEQLSLENKKLYFVANKADLKSHDDIEVILNSFEENLDFAGIEYSGISAYSSVDAEEIAFRKMLLFDFLDTQNYLVDLHSTIIAELQSVFDLYDKAINEDIEFTKNIRKDFKSLELDLLETGFDKYGNKVSSRINKMRKLFELADLEKHLQHLKKVKSQILDEVHRIFCDLPSYR